MDESSEHMVAAGGLAPGPKQTRSLQRSSTVDLLAAELRESILNGEMDPGTPVREGDLAETYGVSRHTFRAAVQLLVGDGLLRHEQHRGAFVPTFQRDDVIEIYVVRLALESEAVLRLAGGEGDVAVAESGLAALVGAESESNWRAVLKADLGFHHALVLSVGCERLSRAFAAVEGEMRLCLLWLQRDFENSHAVVGQHSEILDTIKAGDPSAAVACIRDHLEEARDDILARAFPASPAPTTETAGVERAG